MVLDFTLPDPDSSPEITGNLPFLRLQSFSLSSLLQATLAAKGRENKKPTQTNRVQIL